jgi:hypothetical protein
MRVEVAFEAEEQTDLLQIPWEAAEADNRYIDLRENPDAVDRLEPARQHPPLRGFLAALNSADSFFATARSKTEHRQERPRASAEAARDSSEFVSRVDLIFAAESFNFERARYEELARRLQELLTRDTAPDALRAELRVRPCRFGAHSRTGFCLEILLYARGSTPEQAELRWGLGLARIQQALLFSSRILRQQMAPAT